jgi:hypothetical protein
MRNADRQPYHLVLSQIIGVRDFAASPEVQDSLLIYCSRHRSLNSCAPERMARELSGSEKIISLMFIIWTLTDDETMRHRPNLLSETAAGTELSRGPIPQNFC